MRQINKFLRYFIRLAYNGGPYHGWQLQPNAPSVQAVVNEQLSTLFQHKINVVGAGRTDAGVHAKEMYAHFNLPVAIADVPLAINRLNKMVGRHIAIYDIFLVTNEAHARFDALSRSYEYHLYQNKNPFKHEFAAYLRHPLNFEAMQEATALLLGIKDFTAFSKSHTQTHTNICNIFSAHWEHDSPNWVFHISANRFLRNMVRAIVGTLINVGRGRIMPQDITSIIDSKNRSNAGESVPAHGLYLTKITYPKTTINGSQFS